MGSINGKPVIESTNEGTGPIGAEIVETAKG